MILEERLTKTDDDILIKKWQDYVLANAILANYLNILKIHASRSDFTLGNVSKSCITYVTTLHSFRQSVSVVSGSIQYTLLTIYQDLNRIEINLKRIPNHLKIILLLIKKGTKDSIEKNLLNLLRKGENLVTESLVSLRNPKLKIEQIKNHLIELQTLVSTGNVDPVLIFQIEDVLTQCTHLTDLFTQLAIQAEKSTHHMLLQFNWILEEFSHLDIDTHRELIINLLKRKAIEIDDTIDLLTIITQTYIDISSDYTNDKLANNIHLIFLTNEQEQKESLKQFRHELQPQVVKIARLALKRHDEFLQRNQTRQTVYEKFLNEMSTSHLNLLLSMD